MTGEQKPGGLEPYGWIYETFAPGAGWCAGPEWWPAKFTRTPPNPETTRNVIALYTTPAEPAEARIRELVELVGQLQADFDDCNLHRAAAVQRADAAEAKLAQAVEGFGAIKKAVHGNAAEASATAFSIASQTLAALQQGTQDQ